MTSVYSLGFGIGTRNSKGNWLEVLFPQPLLNPSIEMTTCVTSLLGVTSGNQTIELQHSHLQALSAQLKRIGDQQQATLLQQLGHSQQPLVAVVLHNDTAPQSVPEGYLKLQLLSHRLVKPRQMNLDGIFALLPNVAWTNQGAVDLAELPERQLQARLKGELLQVSCIDKFPKMTDYVVPSGVRIADTARVRLGA
nr:tetrahydrodipicolinate N-succinyltransferase N-terminal domain-containing protein [Gammaproteobacteria bacterium]